MTRDACLGTKSRSSRRRRCRRSTISPTIRTEYKRRDRFSFVRFLGFGLEDAVLDGKTLWLYREALGNAIAINLRINWYIRL